MLTLHCSAESHVALLSQLQLAMAACTSGASTSRDGDVSEQTGECEAEVPNPVVSLLDQLKSPIYQGKGRSSAIPPQGKRDQVEALH